MFNIEIEYSRQATLYPDKRYIVLLVSTLFEKTNLQIILRKQSKHLFIVRMTPLINDSLASLLILMGNSSSYGLLTAGGSQC